MGEGTGRKPGGGKSSASPFGGERPARGLAPLGRGFSGGHGQLLARTGPMALCRQSALQLRISNAHCSSSLPPSLPPALPPSRPP